MKLCPFCSAETKPAVKNFRPGLDQWTCWQGHYWYQRNTDALAGVPDPAALMAAVRECVAADEQFQAALVKPKHGESIMAAEDRLFAALRRLGEVVGK
jgi:hypothetical protein